VEVALRFSTDELLKLPSESYESEAHEVISNLSEIPDLWDVKSSSWVTEAASARFSEQGAQEPINSFVKPLTNRPVVGVGRFTSPDAMVSQIKRGVLDLIGAARPSIADPFLPNKINEGREDEIRECISCVLSNLKSCDRNFQCVCDFIGCQGTIDQVNLLLALPAASGANARVSD